MTCYSTVARRVPETARPDRPSVSTHARLVPTEKPPTLRPQLSQPNTAGGEVSKRHRPTSHGRGNWLHLDFSKREDPSAGRARVIAWLDEINPDWKRYVKVYPRVDDQAS